MSDYETENSIEFMQDLRNSTHCFSWLSMYKENEDGMIECPECKTANPYFLGTRSVWKCRKCRITFSVTTNTFMHGSHVDICKWCAVVFLIANEPTGTMNYEIFRALNLSQKTTWYMMHRIRMAMMTPTFTASILNHDYNRMFAGFQKRNWKAKNTDFDTNSACTDDNFMELITPLMQVPWSEVVEQMRIYKETKHLRQPKRKRIPTEKQKIIASIHNMPRYKKEFIKERPAPGMPYVIREATEEDFRECEQAEGKCLNCKASCSRQIKKQYANEAG